MPDPTRPVAGAPIDTDWGQQVHDRVFQPKGVRVNGDTQAVGVSYAQLDLSNIQDDPGGWVSADTLTVPTGAGGLYSYSLRISTVNGNVGERTIIQIRVNGSVRIAFRVDCNGGTTEFAGIADIEEYSAGDEIEIWGAKTGGPNHDVIVRGLSFVLIGTSIGA